MPSFRSDITPEGGWENFVIGNLSSLYTSNRLLNFFTCNEKHPVYMVFQNNIFCVAVLTTGFNEPIFGIHVCINFFFIIIFYFCWFLHYWLCMLHTPNWTSVSSQSGTYPHIFEKSKSQDLPSSYISLVGRSSCRFTLKVDSTRKYIRLEG